MENSTNQKIGRNDPCPCGAKKNDGSPVKYKKCHMHDHLHPEANERDHLLKREIGGQKVPGEFVLGPLQFSNEDGSSVMSLGPPIVAFDFGVANALNRLRKSTLEHDEFLTEFNTMLENLIADLLIYFQNRLKRIAKKNNVGQMNSVDAAIKEYRRFSIELASLCDIEFLKKIDRVRGRKHHSDQRYCANYTIDNEQYDTVEKLRELVDVVKKEIHCLDEKLEISHPSYKVQVEKDESEVSVSWTAIDHAFDLTGKGRIIPKKPYSQPQENKQTHPENPNDILTL